MKKKQLSFFLYSFIAVLLFSGCKKSDSSGDGSKDPITTAVSGQILDDGGRPLNNVNITAGSSSATTDGNGYFFINNVTIDKKAGLIKAEKAGYFPGSRTIVVSSGNNFIRIRLIQQQSPGLFNSASGGKIKVPNGGFITFGAGSIAAPDGRAYTGNVNVYSYFIDPSAVIFTAVMPGALRGTNTAGQERGLKSFGMLAVELTGAAGQKLQLAAGKTATLEFPIPATLQVKAPASIPLWSFNEQTGLWKEEGSATRIGNNYEGKVGHFSFWNCDDPLTLVTFKASFKDEAGKPLSNVRVEIALADQTDYPGDGYTNNEGFVSGMIPSAQPLLLKVYDHCNNVLLSKNIGPFATDPDLGTINIPSISNRIVTVAGTAVNCSGEAITKGIVTLVMNGKIYWLPVTDGKFNLVALKCKAVVESGTLTIWDQSGSAKSDPAIISLSEGTINTGTIKVCNKQTTPYLEYSIEGRSGTFKEGTDELSFGQGLQWQEVTAGKKDGSESVKISVLDHDRIGIGLGSAFALDAKIGGQEYDYPKDPNYYYEVYFTEWGKVGEYISGTVSTRVRNKATKAIVPAALSFRVKRKS